MKWILTIFISLIMVSCSSGEVPYVEPPVPWTPIGPPLPAKDCADGKVCAYTGEDVFLGTVYNHHYTETDKSKWETEIVSKQGYHMYINEKNEEEDSSFSKTVFLSRVWPFTIDGSADSLAIRTLDNKEIPKSVVNFTTTEDGTYTKPTSVCYEGTPETNTGENFMEYSFYGRDSVYKNVYQYNSTNSAINTDYNLVTIQCDEKTTGFPDYLKDSVFLKASDGNPYDGEVDKGEKA